MLKSHIKVGNLYKVNSILDVDYNEVVLNRRLLPEDIILLLEVGEEKYWTSTGFTGCKIKMLTKNGEIVSRSCLNTAAINRMTLIECEE